MARPVILKLVVEAFVVESVVVVAKLVVAEEMERFLMVLDAVSTKRGPWK